MEEVPAAWRPLPLVRVRARLRVHGAWMQRQGWTDMQGERACALCCCAGSAIPPQARSLTRPSCPATPAAAQRAGHRKRRRCAGGL